MSAARGGNPETIVKLHQLGVDVNAANNVRLPQRGPRGF
jgi:hypothetical protein